MKFLVGLVALAAAALALPATAATITWGGLSDGALVGTYDEGGFRFTWGPRAYSQLLGGVRVVGNDPTVIDGDPATGFTVTRIGGGLFSFDSVAAANLNGVIGPADHIGESRSSTYLVFGYLAGEQVTGQESLALENELFTSFSNSTTMVDSLLVILGAGIFPNDIETVTNLTMTAMPEPAILALFGLGAFGLGLSRQRKI